MKFSQKKHISKFVAFSVSLLVTLNFYAIAESSPNDIYSKKSFSAEDVNAFDRLIMNPYSKPLDYAGSAFTAITLATPALLLPAPDLWKIGIEYVETIGAAYAAKEIFKNSISRPRPYMYFSGAPSEKIEDGDWDDSFISGHTTLSFAAATFTTYKFLEYFPDSVYTPYVIAASYSLAAGTAVLRLSSGNHFMTDVICGAAVGSLLGFLVPWVNSFWFKPSVTSSAGAQDSSCGAHSESDFSLTVLPTGFSAVFRF